VGSWLDQQINQSILWPRDMSSKFQCTVLSQSGIEKLLTGSGLKKISKARQEHTQNGVQIQNGVTKAHLLALHFSQSQQRSQ
jgi:hypothetical protein